MSENSAYKIQMPVITQKKAHNIFWLLHRNKTFVSFKAVFSVDISLLKPYCSESSKLLNATIWRKVLHKSFSIHQKKKFNCDRTVRFVILKWNPKPNKDFLKHLAYKAKQLAGKTKRYKMEYVVKGGILDTCWNTSWCWIKITNVLKREATFLMSLMVPRGGMLEGLKWPYQAK
jgi:hypothetical protein